MLSCLPGKRRALALLVAAVAVSGCRSEAPGDEPDRPNILLITVDTLRPDALGWVAGSHSTPVIDSLAGEGFAFPTAVAPMPLTLPSHLSLLSGRLPRHHGVRDNGQVVPAGVTLLPQILGPAGYATAAFVSGLPLAREFGADAGFAHYDDTLTAGSGAWLERPAPETASAASAWLDDAPEPWFVWVHFFDPHLPYEPPPELMGAGPRGAYLGEVALVDRTLGPLFERTRAGSTRELLTVFAADHGESLGEHGEATHGYFIYDATMLVPLIFHWPGRLAAGRSDEPARLIDVLPTLLDLLELPVRGDVDGASLVPLLEGESWQAQPAYLATFQPWTSYGWSPLSAVRHGGWKLIVAPQPELYDLEADPSESENRLATHPDRARELRRLLSELESPPAAAAETASDAETLRRLEALGYVGAGALIEPPRENLADPKERLELRDLLTRGLELSDAGDVRGAISAFDRVLAIEPGNRFALSRSGVALLRLGDAERAIERLMPAVEAHPGDAESRTALAEALMYAGRFEPAIEQWRELARQRPRQPLFWSNLGAALGRGGRAAEAVVALERALELAPNDLDRLARVAFARYAAADVDGAVRDLERLAARAGRERFGFAGALGLLLLEVGRSEDAESWLEASRPPEGDFARARLALVRLALGAGQTARARDLLRQGVTLDPSLRRLANGEPELRELL